MNPEPRSGGTGMNRGGPNPMKNNFTRRNFLQTAAGAAGLALATKAIALPEPAYAQQWAAGPNGQLVNFGIIGIGMQGSGLLKTAVELPKFTSWPFGPAAHCWA